METEEENKPKMVQTYAEDVVQVIQSDKSGLIKKIIHGEEEAEEQKQNLSPEAKKNKLYLVLSFLLLFAAGGFLAFSLLKAKVPPLAPENQFTPLIFNDKTVFIEIDGLEREAILQKVLSEINTTSVKAGGVEGIYLAENKQLIGLRRFIAVIGATFMPPDNTLFVSNNFSMGIVNNNTKDFFILLKMRTTPDIFESMQAWEKRIFAELYPYFGIELSADTNYLLTSNFTDGIVENKNARMLYDNDGKLVLMYIFADDNSVIITNTNKAAKELMLRVASSQVKK